MSLGSPESKNVDHTSTRHFHPFLYFRLQTDFSQRRYSLFNSLGTNGFYKGLSPLWARQIPYTMAKFSLFEKVVSIFYTHVFTKPKETYGKNTQLLVTFMSGYLAGVICAIVSHPADTMVSKLNQMKTEGTAV